MSVQDVQNEKPEEEDDLIDLVGGDGPWQRYIFIIAITCTFLSGSHNMVMSFFAPNLDHWCSRPPDLNLSVEEWKNIAIPSHETHCSRYKYLNNTNLQEYKYKDKTWNETLMCDSWEYDDTVYKSTVLSQFDLVCDREWLISLSKSIFTSGYFLSSTLFGYLADKYGRKPLVFLCNAIALLSSVISMFSTSFLMFSITRFFIAAGATGIDNIIFVLIMEIVNSKYRPAYGIGINAGWVLGYLCLPAIALIFRHWIYMQIALTVPFIFLLSTWWLLPESPRWLLANGKTEKAFGILSKAAKRNGFDISDAEIKVAICEKNKIPAYEHKSANANIFQLFKPGLWQKTIVLYFIWFINAFMYYGISYNTNELAGDPFLNFALYGVVEIPAYILSYAIVEAKGRRMTQAMSCLASGLFCFLIYPIPEDPWWMREIVSLLGKFCITCSFSILYVFTTEILPTTVRTAGLGSAQVIARFGAIIAPFVKEIGKASHPFVPQLIFGVMAATAGLLTLLLPETKNQSVPDTIQDAAQRTRKKTAENRNESTVPLKELQSQTKSIH